MELEEREQKLETEKGKNEDRNTRSLHVESQRERKKNRKYTNAEQKKVE